MNLSEIGAVAQKFWVEIPHHFRYVRLDRYVIMPNHLHGILILDRCPSDNDNSGGRDVACNVSTTVMANIDVNGRGEYDLSAAMSAMSPRAGSISVIMRSYKSAVSRWCKQNGYPSFRWQSRFHDRIIRDDDSLDRVRRYIANNPASWKEDQNNPANSPIQ